MRTAGRPAAGNSPSVEAPARITARSAAAQAKAMQSPCRYACRGTRAGSSAGKREHSSRSQPSSFRPLTWMSWPRRRRSAAQAATSRLIALAPVLPPAARRAGGADPGPAVAARGEYDVRPEPPQDDVCLQRPRDELEEALRRAQGRADAQRPGRDRAKGDALPGDELGVDLAGDADVEEVEGLIRGVAQAAQGGGDGQRRVDVAAATPAAGS